MNRDTYLAGDSCPPLPEWIIDAYAVLDAATTDPETSDSQHQLPAISREQTVDVLCLSDELALEPEDAEHAITRLLNRGYFYEGNTELRMTTPPK